MLGSAKFSSVFSSAKIRLLVYSRIFLKEIRYLEINHPKIILALMLETS